MENKEQGLRYNSGKPHWTLMDFESFEPMIRVLEYGKHKYSVYEDENGNKIKGSEISIEEAKNLKVIYSGRDDWKKGFPLSELLESLERHWIAISKGELIDIESNCEHIGHLMCNAMFISYTLKHHPEFNDLNIK